MNLGEKNCEPLMVLRQKGLVKKFFNKLTVAKAVDLMKILKKKYWKQFGINFGEILI